VAVCSRSQETGRTFAERYAIDRVHTSLAALSNDADVDAAYIASPNSLHADQSITLLQAGKHVLAEKPLGASAHQVAAIAQAARAAQRVAMEAYVAPREPNVLAIRDALPSLGALRRVVLVKDQYSSRYDALKAGQLPNAFNPAFAAGSLMDLGFYGVALAVHLFGPPHDVTATGLLLPSGVDGQGTVLLGYDGFEVAILHSKLAPSAIDSQIAGEDGVLSFDDCSVPTRVTYTTRGGAPTSLTRQQSEQHMRYEVEEFLRCVRTGQPSQVWPVEQSLTVARVLDEARARVGVRFPSDT
jgi:predicted dehydrogenase